jgi:hypothetical protein
MVDDSVRPRFDNDPEWPWVMNPPSKPQLIDDQTIGRFDWYGTVSGVSVTKPCMPP